MMYLPKIRLFAIYRYFFIEILLSLFKQHLKFNIMGVSQTKPDTQQQKLAISHPKFVNAKHIEISKEELGIQISVPVANEKQIEFWQNQMKKAPLNSQSLLLPKKHKFTKEGFCGSSGYVNIVYDNFPFLLSDQIINRESLDHRKFEESELWYLAYTLIISGNAIHADGQKIGDVRPRNIFINQEGQVKIATSYSWPSQQTNYSKTFYEKEVTYLSPEEMKDLQLGKMEASSEIKTSEAFSIGLTILDAALLQNSQQLYKPNHRFDFDGLNKKLDSLLQQGFSELFTMLVSNLCTSNLPDRCTCNQLFEWLRTYQESIVNLEDFEVNGVPEKLIRTKRGQTSPLRPFRVEQFHQYSGYKEGSNIPSQGVFSIQPVDTFKPTNPVFPVYPQTTSSLYKYQSSNWTSNPVSSYKGYEGSGSYSEKTYGESYTPTYYGGNTTTSTNIERVTATTVVKSSQADSQFKSYLDKIDQQLKESRKNFPSS